MGRRKSVRELEKQLEYARNLANYKPPEREQGTPTARRPKIAVKYNVLSSLAPANAAFTVQASKESVEFFTKAALGLADSGTDAAPPRGFRPAQMNAMVADSTPQLVRAEGSKRPYIRYGRGTRGSNTQYNYTAPVSASAENGIDTRVAAAVTAAQGKVGGAFGRIWYEAERYPFSASGQ